MPKKPLSMTSIPGIRVGHAHDDLALTGVSVVLCEAGAVGGVDQRGGAPGTRETDALHPMHLVEKVHAIVLAGGSAFGLDSASGVVRYLEERGTGFDVGVAVVPIVPAAILFDLALGSAAIRPDAALGYQACLNASEAPPAEGNVGAGMGCSVGKVLGISQAMKAGIGCATIEISRGLMVSALIAVNAFGDVVDPGNGKIIAGARLANAAPANTEQPFFADTLQVFKQAGGRSLAGFRRRENTVIGVIVTNARFNKEQINKVAQMAQDGLARSVRPAHTMLDGDTLFALATGGRSADVNIVGAFAAEAVARAVLRAVYMARAAGGLPAVMDLPQLP